MNNAVLIGEAFDDTFIYIENSLGERAPFVLPSSGGIRILNVEIVEDTDSKQLEVTVENHKCDTADNMMLVCGLYNGETECVETYVINVSNLVTGEKRAITFDFENSIPDYTCKVFLWGKNALSPVCPTWVLSE